MKALGVQQLPRGDWRLEIKLDGYRAIAVINQGRTDLWSRNVRPLTSEYPEIAGALARLPVENAVIDGEIVALDPAGRSRFQLLQGRAMSGAQAPVVYYVFDLLSRDGQSLQELPLERRQKELAALIGAGGSVVRCSRVFEMDSDRLLAEVRARGLEGIIAKRAGSKYEPGRRSGAWLKVKVHAEQEFVIGGFTEPKNSRTHFGAILVGYFEGRQLLYAGKVGSGFDRARLTTLHREFLRREVDACPFANLPMSGPSRFGAGMTSRAMKNIAWVKPELVAQVRFAEWTHDGLLRQPVFLGLRHDKSAREVRREAAAAEMNHEQKI
jgi:bifunctional non-homologous end joining protein LigD